MSLSPQKFREIVFQLLYSYEMGKPENEVMVSLMMSELEVSKKNVRLAQERVQRILSNLSEIDSLISSVSTSYTFERIQTVTKTILRIGMFELFFDDKIPPKVAISEAIRLSRKFSTPESATFVNALLDQLYQRSLGQKVDLLYLEQQAEKLVESEERVSQPPLEFKSEAENEKT